MRQMTSLELSNGVRVHLRVINPRMIKVRPVDSTYEILNEDGKLVGLNYDGGYFISEGTILTVGKQKYKINEIIKSKTSPDEGYELYTFRKITATGNFLLPFLGGTRHSFRWNQEFVNAFLGDENANTDNNEISLLYRFQGTVEYGDFEEGLKQRADFVKITDPDKYTVLYTFKLPEEFKEDIDLILQGKYSQISEKAKTRILQFHSSSKTKPIGQILYRCPLRKAVIEQEIGGKIPLDNELFEMFNVSNEIFKTKYKIECKKQNKNPL